FFPAYFSFYPLLFTSFAAILISFLSYGHQLTSSATPISRTLIVHMASKLILLICTQLYVICVQEADLVPFLCSISMAAA
ncbi:hypothetical protein PFISCL1PPCAC_15246, partial [Pristionchus fissidentatus]